MAAERAWCSRCPAPDRPAADAGVDARIDGDTADQTLNGDVISVSNDVCGTP